MKAPFRKGSRPTNEGSHAAGQAKIKAADDEAGYEALERVNNLENRVKEIELKMEEREADQQRGRQNSEPGICSRLCARLRPEGFCPCTARPRTSSGPTPSAEVAEEPLPLNTIAMEEPKDPSPEPSAPTSAAAPAPAPVPGPTSTKQPSPAPSPRMSAPEPGLVHAPPLPQSDPPKQKSGLLKKLGLSRSKRTSGTHAESLMSGKGEVDQADPAGGFQNVPRGGISSQGQVRGGMSAQGQMRGGVQSQGQMRGGVQSQGQSRGGAQSQGAVRGGALPQGATRGGAQASGVSRGGPQGATRGGYPTQEAGRGGFQAQVQNRGGMANQASQRGVNQPGAPVRGGANNQGGVRPQGQGGQASSEGV
ncbi:hypothetical protein ACHWQZ_G007602 [Mnemiopsis leidyi]